MSATNTTLHTWAPTKAEVAQIVVEMRPIIDQICARDQQRRITWSELVRS